MKGAGARAATLRPALLLLPRPRATAASHRGALSAYIAAVQALLRAGGTRVCRRAGELQGLRQRALGNGSHCAWQRHGAGAKRRLAAAAACLAPQQHGPPTPYCSRLTCSATLLLKRRYMIAGQRYA